MLDWIFTPLFFDYIVCVFATVSFVLHIHGLKNCFLKIRKRGFITRILILSVSLFKLILELDYIFNGGYDLTGYINNILWCLSDLLMFTIFIYTYLIYRNE